jgi:GR25 family glycosyltransferase involved in LPS biosynthesis
MLQKTIECVEDDKGNFVKKNINKNKIILNKQPKTFVIALKDNTISLSQLNNCLITAKQNDWNIEVFWGTNGKTLSLDSWKQIGVTPLLHKGSMNKLGTWGCFFSHFSLWNKCIELNEPIVILEHDAIIKYKWISIEVSDALVKLHEDYSFKIDSRGWIDPDGFVDSNSGQASASTHAYCITPEQANKLIYFAKTVGGYATDRMMGDKVLPVIHMGNPTIVDRQNTHSTTENL